MLPSILSTKMMKAFVLFCMGLSFAIAGCSTTAKVAQSSKGTVYLEEVTDWSFEASHPAVIDESTMTKLLAGVYHDDGQSESSKMPAGGGNPMRVFSDEDTIFLVPLLTQGLSKAKPEQLVRFRVSSSAGSGVEPIAGSIYAKNGSAYLTITKGAGSTTFMPQYAAHQVPVPAFTAAEVTGATTQVVNVAALANAPMPTPTSLAQSEALAEAAPATVSAASLKDSPDPAVTSSPVGENAPTPVVESELTQAKKTLAAKDTEIKMLRKESEWMKRKLRARDAEVKALQATVKKKLNKKAHVQRTR